MKNEKDDHQGLNERELCSSGGGRGGAVEKYPPLTPGPGPPAPPLPLLLLL